MMSVTYALFLQAHPGVWFRISITWNAWWRHQMETFFALLDVCETNSPVTAEFTSQMPVTRIFDVFFDLPLNKRLSKPTKRRWFEPPPRPLWRRCNENISHFLCYVDSHTRSHRALKSLWHKKNTCTRTSTHVHTHTTLTCAEKLFMLLIYILQIFLLSHILTSDVSSINECLQICHSTATICKSWFQCILIIRPTCEFLVVIMATRPWVYHEYFIHEILDCWPCPKWLTSEGSRVGTWAAASDEMPPTMTLCQIPLKAKFILVTGQHKIQLRALFTNLDYFHSQHG